MLSCKIADLFILILLLTGFRAEGQTYAAGDSLLHALNLSEVVVTATRSNRKLADVPIPVMVIGQEQIQSAGASRLDDILSEQTGLAITYAVSANHGFGIQMEGLDPKYCLILVNGEPMTGQTAGTIDLSRFTVNNIKRIEIIKGPSSSLYGSDALAGVINIITKDKEQTAIYLKSQYGAYRTSDLTATGSLAFRKGSATLSVNRFQTKGYNLVQSTTGPTVPPYTDYTFNGSLHYALTPRLGFTVSGRYFSEKQKNDYLTTNNKDTLAIHGNDMVYDGGVNPVLNYHISQRWKLKLHNYWSWYHTQNGLYDQKADTLYDGSYFRQSLWKEELQSQNMLNSRQILTTGLGFTKETVVSTLYTDKNKLSDYYFYAQHEWHPAAHWNILSGLRYDLPTVYHARLSPKIAAQYKRDQHWTFRASIGTGYKAPDFEELYLSFSNPVVGYTVLGAQAVKSGLAEMQREGLVSRVYVNPGELSADLEPESAVAYNLGGTYTAAAGWRLSAGLFRNDVKNLIDTRAIAMKSNGQPVYGYYNIDRIFTEGLTADGSLPLLNDHLLLSAGYQFLIAKDKDVADEIRQGEVFIRNPQTLETRKLRMSEYGGLFNRSKHRAHIKINYRRQDWSANVRVIYQSRFGFADLNGDNMLDAGNEYARGFAVCNLNIARSCWSDQLIIQSGVKDLFNYKDPEHLPYVPGRTWYVSASLNLVKENHHSSDK